MIPDPYLALSLATAAAASLLWVRAFTNTHNSVMRVRRRNMRVRFPL